jgi:hypothetical protein
MLAAPGVAVAAVMDCLPTVLRCRGWRRGGSQGDPALPDAAAHGEESLAVDGARPAGGSCHSGASGAADPGGGATAAAAVAVAKP